MREKTSSRKNPKKVDIGTFESSIVYPVLIYITEKLNEMKDYRQQEKILKILNDVNISSTELSKIKNYKFYIKVKSLIIQEYYDKIEKLKDEYDLNLVTRIRNFIQTKIMKVNHFSDLLEYYKVLKEIKTRLIENKTLNRKDLMNHKNYQTINKMIENQIVFVQDNKLILTNKANSLIRRVERDNLK